MVNHFVVKLFKPDFTPSSSVTGAAARCACALQNPEVKGATEEQWGVFSVRNKDAASLHERCGPGLCQHRLPEPEQVQWAGKHGGFPATDGFMFAAARTIILQMISSGYQCFCERVGDVCQSLSCSFHKRDWTDVLLGVYLSINTPEQLLGGHVTAACWLITSHDCSVFYSLCDTHTLLHWSVIPFTATIQAGVGSDVNGTSYCAAAVHVGPLERLNHAKWNTTSVYFR